MSIPDPINVRASSLPLAFRCPASIHRRLEGHIAIDGWNEPAELGTAVHAAFAEHLDTGQLVDTDQYARRFDVPEAEVQMLYNAAVNLWSAISHSMGESFQTEVAMEMELAPRLNISGHADIVAHPNEHTLAIIDLKTGRRDVDHRDQLLGYAALALEDFPGITKVQTIILWARDLVVESDEFTAIEVKAWGKEFAEKVMDWDGRYIAGGHCAFCPVAHGCPARALMLEGAAAELSAEPRMAQVMQDLRSDNEEDRLAAHAMALSLYERTSVIAKMVDTFRAAIRHEIEMNGPIADEIESLSLETQTRRTLKPAQSMDVFANYLPLEDLLSCAKLSKTAVFDLIAENAEHGTKAGIKRQLNKELEQADAFMASSFKVLKLRRIPKEIEDKNA